MGKLIGPIIGITVAWLIISFFGSLMLMDTTPEYRRMPYTEVYAIALLWPVVVPIFIIKFWVDVVSSVPKAIRRVWSS